MSKKQAASAAIFIALFLTLLVMVTYCLRTNGSVKDRFVGFYAEPKNTIDTIMIGSSPVFPYYATPQMYGEEGLVCYPLSTNLQRPVAQLYLTKEALKYQSPSLLIYEVRMYTGRESDMTNNMAYTRGVTDNMRYSLNRLETINAMVTDDLTADDTERYTYYFDIFKYHSNWKTLFLPSQLRTALYAWPDAMKGYESTDEVGPCTLQDWSGETATTPIPEIQEQHLTELMDYLEEKGQNALFIVSPYLHTQEQAQMFNYIGEKVSARGFGFLNLNQYYEEIGIDGDRDFNDYGNHTNASGAQKVTAFFEKYLKENYDLPDRRGEDSYASWEKAYEKWQQVYAEAMTKIDERIADKDYAQLGTEEE